MNRARTAAGEILTNDDYIDTRHFGLLYLWAQHRDELAPWWGENGSSTDNDATQRLAAAFTNLHQGRAKFPTFKSRGRSGSVRFTNQSVRLSDSHHVRIARVGTLTTYESTRKLHRHLERGTGTIKAATVSHVGGKFYVSFTVQVQRTLCVTRPPERAIGVEDLNIAGMLKNHSRAKRISDAAWGEFTAQLEYKTQWYGSTLVKAPRFYPSSKSCASCGAVKAKLPLEVRTFACEVCAHVSGRDLNAAINLARLGLAGTNSVTGRGGEVRPDCQQLDMTAHPDEASTDTPPEVGA
ncbi:MAG: transposase [Acidimicrobiaceae bacterium]|nr:transposase [Acidimicrobiaceae bacterium]